jgi:hypothetical protein
MQYWPERMPLLNRDYPRYGERMELPFPYDKADDGKGI